MQKKEFHKTPDSRAFLLKCADKTLDLHMPQVMGVLNVTSDSFFDGGLYATVEAALEYTEVMVAEGASMIDVGGESTRPGAKAVSVQEELDRVIPVIEAINRSIDTIISIDTSKAEVTQAAVNAGARFINDVYSLQQEGALESAKRCNVPVCLMHMNGEPRTMQDNPQYTNVVNEVFEFLAARKQACMNVGIPEDQIIVDPGFGFGKSVIHNLDLVAHLEMFSDLKSPLLIGFSRKSTIGHILDADNNDRLYGGLALVSLAIQKGASIIRTHDVKATVDTIKMVHAVMKEL